MLLECFLERILKCLLDCLFLEIFLHAFTVGAHFKPLFETLCGALISFFHCEPPGDFSGLGICSFALRSLLFSTQKKRVAGSDLLFVLHKKSNSEQFALRSSQKE